MAGKVKGWVLEVPAQVATETVTLPPPLGTLAVTVSGLTTLTVVAVVAPKATVVAEVNPMPWRVTVEPGDADGGVTEERVGAVTRASPRASESPVVAPVMVYDT